MNHSLIMEGIRGNPTQRREAIQFLLHDQDFWTILRAYVIRNSGTTEDATDVFHDTIVVFTKKVFKNRDFVLQGTVQAYMMGTAKNLWLTELRKKKNNPKISEISDVQKEVVFKDDIEELILKNELAGIVSSILDKMRTRCKEVIQYWSSGYKMREIASLLNYKSEGMARKKKSECMKQLYAYLRDNPDVKEQIRAY